MTMFRVSRARVMGVLLAGAATVLLGACASGPDKPKPTQTGSQCGTDRCSSGLDVRIGPVNFPLDINVNGNTGDAGRLQRQRCCA